MWERYIDFKAISAAENSNKFQKTRFCKEKSVENMFTLGANVTGHTYFIFKNNAPEFLNFAMCKYRGPNEYEHLHSSTPKFQYRVFQFQILFINFH
jgi:hypothetical protein